MTFLDFLILLLIAAIAGAIGQSLAGYTLGGCAVSAVIGFLGAYIGMWIARELGLPTFLTIEVGGRNFPFIWSVLGSMVLTLILGLISRRRLL